MRVLEFLDEFGQDEIGLAIAIAMPAGAALGNAEGLDRRLGQIIDQDRPPERARRAPIRRRASAI